MVWINGENGGEWRGGLTCHAGKRSGHARARRVVARPGAESGVGGRHGLRRKNLRNVHVWQIKYLRPAGLLCVTNRVLSRGLICMYAFQST